MYGAQVANIRFREGRLHELLPLMHDALDAAPELHGYRAAIALGHALGGDHATARMMIEAEVATGFDVREDDGWFFTVGTWARAAAALGHRPAAELLHPKLAPYAQLFVHATIVVGGFAAMNVGQLEHALGRFDDADRSFADAAELNRRLESPMFDAENDVHWAAMLLDRDQPGDRERARTLATSALEIAVAGGYGDTDRLARHVLARLDS